MDRKQTDKNFDLLIDALEKGVEYEAKPVYFHMGSWFTTLNYSVSHEGFDDEGTDHIESINECGSAACLAGFIRILQGKNALEEHDDSFEQAGREFLGLDTLTARELFEPWEVDKYHYVPISSFTRERAVDTLKRLKETGKVKWRLSPSEYRGEERVPSPGFGEG